MERLSRNLCRVRSGLPETGGESVHLRVGPQRRHLFLRWSWTTAPTSSLCIITCRRAPSRSNVLTAEATYELPLTTTATTASAKAGYCSYCDSCSEYYDHCTTEMATAQATMVQAKKHRQMACILSPGEHVAAKLHFADTCVSAPVYANRRQAHGY